MEEEIEMIRGMGFTHVPRETILQVLCEVGGSMDAAVDRILALPGLTQPSAEPPGSGQLDAGHPGLNNATGDDVTGDDDSELAAMLSLLIPDVAPGAGVGQGAYGGSEGVAWPHGHSQAPQLVEHDRAHGSFEGGAGEEHGWGGGVDQGDEGFHTVRKPSNSGGRRGGRGGGGGREAAGLPAWLAGGGAEGEVRMVVLVGMPGSGKSTVANRFRERGWVIVSQDELGDRRKCEHATQEALHAGGKVVIDRTNIDEHQRSHWFRIARQCRVPAAAIVALHLDVNVRTCKDRVMSRTGHPSLKAERSSLGIVDRFCSDFQRPTQSEGFGRVLVLSEGYSLWDPALVQLVG